jgi:hypothetical protein
VTDVEREHVAEAAHPRLAREMEDPVVAGEVELVLGEVDPQHVAEAGGVLLLDARVVVVREAVEGSDLVAAGDQLLGQMGADEARRSCDHVSHCSTMP